MSSDKPTKKKRKSAADTGASEGPVLRQPSDPRQERRYEPKPSAAGIVTLIAAGAGALLAGAGSYAQWFRAEPHKLAPYLLAAGAAVMIAVALFGSLGQKPVRVGDAGVAIEKEQGEIERIPWYDVTRINLTASALSVHSSGTFITIPRGAHSQAVARIIAEAKARVPERLEGVKTDGLEKLDDSIGTIVKLDPPQVAGQRDKASERLIAFEKDARFCGRCGEVYHRDTVPRACVTCSAPLRS